MENTRSYQHQIFVASSLVLQDKRDAVTEAVNDYNHHHPGTYSCIRYEKDITQCLDKKDAQREINNLLVKSPIFFLIADQNRVKEKTESEFALALRRFRNNEMPRFIFIFNSGSENVIHTEDGNDLLKKHGLIDYQLDESGEIEICPQVYYIPYSDSLNLKERISHQLALLPDRLPPTRAKLGSQLEKGDFYTDHNRKRSFPKAFYHRECDNKLREELAYRDRRLVMVTGYSLSGKTRSVMEALKEVKDGWVYVIGEEKKGLLGELEQLNKYVCRPEHVKLYIEIDNLDQLVADVDDEKTRVELKKLIDNVMNDDCEDKIVATASDFTTVNDALQLDDYGRSHFLQIEIPKLSEKEFHDAVAWFRSCGMQIDDNNTSYGQIGALFVNLNALKNSYNTFLRTNPAVCQALLKAIKAQSIWRDDAFGDKELLKRMTAFFVGNSPDKYEENYRTAVNALCEKGLRGVTTTRNGKKLHVEEYVYQYIIGYDGKTTNNDEDDIDRIDKEKELIRDMICFCIDQREKNPQSPEGGESLMRQVSRILRRCDQSADIVPWLFDLWKGKTEEKLAPKLVEDRKKCENSSAENEKEAHFYAGIVKKYLSTMTKFEPSFKFDSCLEVYNGVPDKFRQDELFAKLIRVAANPEDRNKIQGHPDYAKFKKSPFSVDAEMGWYDDYGNGKLLFEKVENPCIGKTAAQVAERILDMENKPYDIFPYRRILRKLATMAHAQKDYDDLLPLLRKNFVCLLSYKDRKLLEKIKDGEVIINESNLTLIDLFSALGIWQSSQCAMNVFGEDLQSCEKLEQELLRCVKQTLDNKLTNELQVRMLVSSICEKLIRGIAKNSDYEDVYDVLFVPLETDHPNREGQKIIFRNVFTYTAMMECRNTDVQTSMNLFTNNLLPHAKDMDNPLSINTFTLNRMLSKCHDDDRSIYIDLINDLYDRLELKRDIFTYNVLINAARDLPSAHKILETIKEENLIPDLYTYLNILQNNDIDFQEAVQFLHINNCDIESYGSSGNLPDIFSRLIRESGQTLSSIRQNLLSMKKTWVCLFKKNAKGDQTEKFLEICLKYLKEKHPDLLEDGEIYNVLLKNNSFFQDLKEAVDYIEKTLIPFGLEPDGQTANSLLTKVHALKGIDQLVAIGIWNDFITGHPNCLSRIIISRRITLFRNQEDTKTLAFFDEKEKLINKTYSPNQYFQKLVSLNIPIDAFVIRNYLKIKNIENQRTCKFIAKKLKSQYESQVYTPTAEDIRAVREHILPYCEDDELPTIYSRMSVKDYNKSLSWKFKVLHNQKSSRKITAEEVKETLDKLKWEDVNSALWALTEILDKYIENRRDSMNNNMWNTIKGFYQSYIIERGHIPTSFTFALLAKSLTKKNAEGRTWLFAELTKYSNDVIISPHLLGELARTVTSVDELIRQTKAIMNLGCKTNAHTADTYVFWLNRNLMYSDEQRAMPILTDLMQYIFSEKEDKDLSPLQKEERKNLLLDIYRDPRNISALLLQTLLSFNHNIRQKDSTKGYLPEILAEKITKITKTCPDTVSNLMTRLVDNKELRGIYIPIFFDGPRNYSTKVLRYLTSPEQLPAHDIDKYNDLIRKFYRFNCAIPESIVPNLLDCLADYYSEPAITEEQKKRITERLTNAYININQNQLRQGDLIMEKVQLPEAYVEWCHPSLNCLAINDLFDEKKRNIYPTLLKLYTLCDNLNLNKNLKPFKALRRAEEKYAYRIRVWRASLEELARLPNLWYSIHWKPSEELVLTIVRTYIQQPYQSAKYIADLYRAFGYARKNQLPNTFVYYKSIGDFPESNLFYREIPTIELEKVMPHDYIISLCRRVSNKTDDNKIFHYEIEYIELVKGGEISKEQLRKLPCLWKKARNWKPSKELRKLVKQCDKQN